MKTEFKIGFFCVGATIMFAIVHGHFGIAVWAAIAGQYMLRCSMAEGCKDD